jgi:hypothetical protein
MPAGDESFIPRKMNFRPIADSMRMPILGYFLVTGAILFAALAVVGNGLESKPLPVSQTIGVPPPFKEPTAELKSLTDGPSMLPAEAAH